ncbi:MULTISPECIES: UbiA family prenyltransferase [Actinomadura]|uniref:Ubiquinone biosynthesis protein UbiA n=1 Tax=Actinomadura litoris TaxID=2678616 RepID=A0A7K1KVU9_9ACTN|nr:MULTISPECIES: UbiA family prenyltransferase [Actinomadura]MBT2211263.1 UbiA family prenyltransferase [Actinomadura sp. NEAU-AAG7]MUN36177.1 ubiquinone biosynthesis protein UbiA [Actinomadura litoris]
MPGRRLGRTLTAHLRTWRPYTLWYVGLVGLAGATLTREITGGDRRETAGPVVAWLVPTLVWVAAHYLGDYLDRDLDAIDKPQRPIPSGRMRPATALACGAVLAAGACAVALSVNWRTVLVLAGGIGGAVAYNGFFKARGLWGNLVRGALTGAALLFGAMTAASAPPVELLPFVLVFAAHDAASNLVGTLRDVAGDREGGYATFAVRHGVRAGAWTAVALYGAAVAAVLAGLPLLPGDRWAPLPVLLVAVALACHAFRMLFANGRVPPPRVALRSHGVLVVERLVLAGALLVPGLGLPAAVALLLPMLAVTLGTQRAMRSAHEFPSGGPEPTRGASELTGTK